MFWPKMKPPVGKSGPGMIFISSPRLASRLSTKWTKASTSSPRLCGGMEVAMPTAMPEVPFSSSMGSSEGRIAGSDSEPS